ncbi:TetR/AcrR family transcriptional regulator [Mycolicibacterium sp. CBMA 226]|uniref:TetR/AcrR family transcriptional regulator n=1 Tax=Mycolicibacterium sp. CBMA 226 TaxID=2606611 RepID=UPI0012DE866D|nr:TetR family transcriptional regulator [Mycolicibacterium sp. CBMA 226]MUL79057.1 TetR family transcriptional regulator [Mycolicibacterium sp. CBMA 226]QGW61382.1 HTH-type transcriptional regulator RcdA [Mycolicibacterium sp.]
MPRGNPDPARPARIALAALEVVGERGVEGLTHRAVAKAAGVPVGSTTYHFKTLEDLLAAAITEAKKASDVDLLHWAERITPQTEIAAALADYVIDLLDNNWTRLVVELELYLAALRRPNLLTLSRAWDEALPTVLRTHLDPLSARAMALAVDGFLLHAMIHGKPDRDEVEEVLRRIAARSE